MNVADFLKLHTTNPHLFAAQLSSLFASQQGPAAASLLFQVLDPPKSRAAVDLHNIIVATLRREFAIAQLNNRA